MQNYEVDVFRVKKEYDEKEFMRRALTALANEKSTPTDIFTSNFGEVEEDEPSFLEITADTQISLTADIGYDRKVKYADGTTKTVTDWQPYNGTAQSQEQEFVYNGSESEFQIRFLIDRYESTAQAALKNSQKEHIVLDGFELNQEAFDRANSRCIFSCYQTAKKRLPGDRQNNENYTGTTKITDINAYLIPRYSMYYTYADKEYMLSAFACGNDAPTDYRLNGKKMPSAASNVRKEAMKIAQFFFIGMAAAVIAAILLGIFTGLVGGLVAAAVAVALLVTGIVLFVRTKNSIYAMRQKEKLAALAKYLAEHGLSEAESAIQKS